MLFRTVFTYNYFMESVLTLAALPPQARPLNILRDLNAVADLVEICFSETMEREGREYLANMRQSARDSHFLTWAPRMVDSISLPLSGFVWEEQGRIVGNVSLIPFTVAGQRIQMIANVATHPDYRKRGIARTLVSMAMQRARSKGAASLWLNVRHDNPAAIELYKNLGFEARATRVNWVSSVGTLAPQPEGEKTKVIRPRGQDWPAQSKWFARAYPPEMLLGQDFTGWQMFRPGLWAWLQRLFAETEIIHWAARERGRLAGAVVCQRMFGRKDHLWAAFPDNANPQIVTGLLLHARRMLSYSRGLALNYPAGVLDEAIRAAGFNERNRLVWMQAPGVQPG